MIHSIALYVLMLIAAVWVSGSSETVQNDVSCLTEVPHQVEKRLEVITRKLDILTKNNNMQLQKLDTLVQKMNKCCVQPAVGKSCKDILDEAHQRKLNDGVYSITNVKGRKMKVYCDMTRDGGGWTLITAVRTSYGWTTATVYGRNIASPSLTNDYSILGLADSIKKNAKGKTFEYRIEANGRGHWGGIWQAPVSYSFTSTSDAQTNVKLTKRFDKWSYGVLGIEKRMPWISMKNANTLLTTNKKIDGHWWGTLMMKTTTANIHRTWYNLGPWIHPQAIKANKIFYWLREN